MREFLVVCAVLLSVAVLDVQSRTTYRTGHQLQLDDVPKAEIISELRKDSSIPVQVDLMEPVLIIKEELLVPVETLRNMEPSVEVEEPVVVFNKNDQPLAHIHSDKVNAERRDDVFIEATAEIDPNVAPIEDDNETGSEVAVVQEQAAEDHLADDASQQILKQGASTTLRPTLLQQAQQIISNNPFGQFIDTIRRPTTKPPVGEDSAVEATTNANIFQQLQAGVQNFTNQISSALVPNTSNLQASESAPPTTVVRPPNIFETLQTNFQNTVNGIFRPNSDATESGGATPQGPLQAVLSNVQNFLNGNRGETTVQAVTSDAPQKVSLPVDDKVDFSKNSGEVQGNAGSTVPLPESSQKGEDAVILVAEESSLESESA